MKYPNPTFLQKASSVKRARHTRVLIILTVLCVLTLITVFIANVAAMQREYAERFPELTGAATSTTKKTETTPSSSRKARTTTASSSETAPTTAEPTPETSFTVGPATTTPTPETTPSETSEETSETTQDNSADILPEEDVYLRDSHSLQTVTHEERDVLLDSLKQAVTDYAKACPEEKICFRYINLSSNETLGFNDLEPFIPAGAFSLPIEMVYYDRVSQGLSSLDAVYRYDGEAAPGNSSYITDTYQPGKYFTMRTLANYAVTRNDNIALSKIIDQAGGMNFIWPTLRDISSYISYDKNITYYDGKGNQQSGKGRTCAYDMANYCRALYYGLINEPAKYRHLINDLAVSEVPTGYRTAFGNDALILHCSGANDETGSYTDIAIIDGDEPIVVVISCECSSRDRAMTIQADIATYVARFISMCHTKE